MSTLHGFGKSYQFYLDISFDLATLLLELFPPDIFTCPCEQRRVYKAEVPVASLVKATDWLSQLQYETAH